MKKTTKRLLSVGLCAALAISVGCGLAACGGDDDTTNKKPTTPTAVPYWVAGKIKGVDAWGENDGSGVNDATRFAKTDNANIYTVTLDLWEDDSFKIRYDGKSWSEFQLNWSLNFDATQKADEESKIIEDTREGSYPGERNFRVAQEGNYTLKLDVTNKLAVVSYVYNGEATVKAPKPLTDIVLNKTSLTLAPAATETLTATFNPEDADDKTVTWASSDENVATVDQTGKVTAVAEGNATITVTSTAVSTVKATCAVVVSNNIVDVTGVTLGNKPTAPLHAGGTVTLTATVAPEDASNKAVAYTSSAPTIVSVSATGELTALKPGTATITVTADGGKTDTCEVTVATDYYLRGSLYNSWAAVGAVGTEGVIYLTEQTTGVYKTGSVEISKGAEFQVAVVGDMTDDWWKVAIKNSALPTEAAEGDNTLNYFEAEGDSNIKAKTSGKYTITIDLTGENPVFTAVQDENLPDLISSATGLGIWGDAVSTGWAGPAEADKVDFTKGEDGKWTATLSNVTLTANNMQLRWATNFVAVNYGDYKLGEKVTVPSDWVRGTGDIAAKAGTYNITVTLTSTGDVESIVIEAATAA